MTLIEIVGVVRSIGVVIDVPGTPTAPELASGSETRVTVWFDGSVRSGSVIVSGPLRSALSGGNMVRVDPAGMAFRLTSSR